MSKQKIILFISILILLILVVAFYFYVISQKTEFTIEPLKQTPQVIFEEAVLEDLNSFEKPTSEAIIPYIAPDTTIKTETEVQIELDSYVPTQKPSDQEILDLLNNPNFKAY